MKIKQEVVCQRCPRIEHLDVSIEEVVAQAKLKGDVAKPAAITVQVDGKEVAKFDSLCSVCRDLVLRNVKSIAKIQKHKSATRGGETDE